MTKQRSIASDATVRVNNRHVRASISIRQLNLDMRYKPGKEHVVPDILSRLPANDAADLYELALRTVGSGTRPRKTWHEVLDHLLQLYYFRTKHYNNAL